MGERGVRSSPQWARVQALLDARHDPLIDPAVQAWLLHDAEALQEVVTLRAHLAALPVRSRRRRAAAAAAAVLVVAGAWLAWPSPRPAAPDQAALPQPVLAHGDYVRAFSASVELQGDDASYSVTHIERTHVSERRTRWATSPDTGVVCEVCSLDTDLR